MDGLWVHSPNSCSYRVLNSSNIGVKVRRFFGFVLGGIFFFGLPFFSTSSVFFSTSQLFFSLVRLFVNPMRFGSFSTSFQSFFPSSLKSSFQPCLSFFEPRMSFFPHFLPCALVKICFVLRPLCPCKVWCMVYCFRPLCPCKVWCIACRPCALAKFGIQSLGTTYNLRSLIWRKMVFIDPEILESNNSKNL